MTSSYVPSSSLHCLCSPRCILFSFRRQPGDIVAVQHAHGRREGLVVGSHIDYAVRTVPRSAPHVPVSDVLRLMPPSPPPACRPPPPLLSYGLALVLRVFTYRAGKSSRSSSIPERSTTRGAHPFSSVRRSARSHWGRRALQVPHRDPRAPHGPVPPRGTRPQAHRRAPHLLVIGCSLARAPVTATPPQDPSATNTRSC